VGDLLALALGRLGARGIRHGPGHTEAETLGLITRENANGIVGTPTQVLALARQSAAAGLRLHSVLLSTDHVPNAIVNAVEAAWSCTVYNHYGMTEMGLGGGVECQARRGYHLREADILFEIVHPQTGEPVAEGETGEVVFTTLTRGGMPLIRYRSGDLSRFIPGSCPCGTRLKTLARIATRVDGFVPVGEAGELTMAELDEAIFPIEGVLDFVATLMRGAPVDQLKIEARVLPVVEEHAKRSIQDAVGRVSVIARAYLAVDVEAHVSVAGRRPGKRMIVDRRDSLGKDISGFSFES
jgi:phenylacetate-coenzyme A ligase PaaK-like adenylate-forming protein